MLQKLQNLFVRTVDHVERQPVAFTRYYFLFAAILAVRLTLEFFSSRRLFIMDDILHIGLWFIFIVLAFLVQLHLFSGEKIMRVAKLVIVFFSIALTAPIIDLVVTGGTGAKMNYLALHSWKDVAWSYITVGGSSFSRGATPGIRIEIALLIIASFNYVRTKRNSVLMGILAAFSIYTVLFLSGTIPLLLGFIVNRFQLQYQPNDQSTVLLLLLLDVFLLCMAFLRHAPLFIRLLCKSVPWLVVLAALLLAGFGAYQALTLYPSNWQLTPTNLFWFPLLAANCVFMAAYAALQRMQKTAARKKQYDLYKNGVTLLIVIISAMLSDKVFFSTALLWALIFLLHEPPLELINIPVLSSLLHAMLLLASAFAGFCIFNAPMIGFPYVWIWIILVTGFFVAVAASFVRKQAR